MVIMSFMNCVRKYRYCFNVVAMRFHVGRQLGSDLIFFPPRSKPSRPVAGYNSNHLNLKATTWYCKGSQHTNMASATTPDSLLSSLSKHFTHDEKIHTSSPPYSFATDLLGSFEKARKNHTQTLKVLEELAIMIKGRAAVEEVYSQQMARLVSDHTHGLRRLGEALARKAGGGGVNEGNYVTETSSCTIESTFRECVESLKADMLNRSVQRKQLAKNILADVFAPLEDIYDRLASESRGLEDLLGTLTKQGRACESRYRSAHKKYEQAVQLATNACDILTEKRQSLPSLDIQLLHQQYSNSSRAASSATASPFDLKKEDFSAILAESPRKISEAFTQAAKKDIT